VSTITNNPALGEVPTHCLRQGGVREVFGHQEEKTEMTRIKKQKPKLSETQCSMML
jgi:hypothetical protein